LIRGTHIRAALLAAAIGLVLALPGSAQGATSVSLSLPKGKARADLLDKVVVGGLAANPSPGEQVEVTVSADQRELFKKKITPKANGSFEVPIIVNACCRYLVEAKTTGGQSGSVSFTTKVPKKLRKGGIARLFNRSLQAQGFHTGTNGGRVTGGTHLAIKAFRKVNGMSWSEAYRPSIFRTLLRGEGAFKPRFDDGKHVEVDISKQVMSLIEGDRPVHTFHVSTGTGGTPTVQGNFRFYMKQPGYNAKQMYYSVYFIGGYATHGYSDVPNHNASHGCVRNPIPFSRFIYNWIDIGDPMHTYS
jgi:hypothetical protein